MNIKRAAIIGAGNMGAQIALHLANVGIPSIIMDVVPKELTPEETARKLTLQSPEVRNRLARELFERAKKLSPSPMYVPEVARLVKVGNVEDNMADIKNADWIIEAILERMDLKKDIHARIAQHARPDALVTTNTSGLSIKAMVEGLPVEHRRRFFGTHFFNPPRYMRLLEIIPTPDTDPAQVEKFTTFAEDILGKGVVICKDTTGFIANRIGCYSMQNVLWLTEKLGLTFEEVDALTGSAMGRPRSGTFRLGDIVGVDLMVQIGQNFSGELKTKEEKEIFQLPGFIVEMVKRGWHGQKKGQGFYKQVKTEKGKEILTLDPKTLEYRPKQKPAFPVLEAVKKIGDPAERIRQLVAAPDKAGEFAWNHLSGVISYAASCFPEISDDLSSIDNAMKWGFNWELGPLEIWDALGVRSTVARLEKEGRAVPKLVQDLLASGRESFYEERKSERFVFVPGKKEFVPETRSSLDLRLPRLKKNNAVIKSNAGASLIDLGDGVACVEFHSKMNVLGPDQVGMINLALEEVRKNFLGLVVGNQGEHFSAGANIVIFMTQIQNGDWDELDLSIRTFQQTTSRMRFFEKPIVAACQGYTLGGGCEVTFGAHHVMAAAETYMGLPEVGIGVIPGAGGTKEMLLRHTENVPRTEDQDYFPFVRQAWETVGLGKVTSSGPEAQKLLYLRPSESTIVLNKDLLIGSAKAKVLQMREGFRPKTMRQDIPAVGESGFAQLKLILHLMRNGGMISEFDQKIGTKLAHVHCGGDLSTLHFVSEQYILDLEREAFLSLCGEPKTFERIQHMLKTGKPLRN